MDSRFFQVLVVVVTFVVLNTCFAQVRSIGRIECGKSTWIRQNCRKSGQVGRLVFAKVAETLILAVFVRKMMFSEVIIIEQVGVGDYDFEKHVICVELRSERYLRSLPNHEFSLFL